MTREIVEKLIGNPDGRRLVADLSHHMQDDDGIARVQEAHAFAGRYAIAEFNGDVNAMIEDFKTNGLFEAMLANYAKEYLGF
ncbi:hypothetical protein CO038_03135 [Candidatus Pacearchaeota archaeon CG_4_9_14_0_2_um_filter_39_13]|nr:hypothetical protein [Candidatus Pacearchaeota archaeon]OIO42645.1 MAG: hypothetical protein AUJ64_03675 [Candidatus Pacearchaeota archaeon CG1_02_39_14]PJC44561.1 MAG: hypothetical protein CO038_03135 [Candidatus Pacearchaeota archaeon CG_4_9_14_0_2_um_filter_39_13]